MSPNFTKASHVDFVQNVTTLNWIEKYVVYLRQLYINGSNTVADPGRTKRSLLLLTRVKIWQLKDGVGFMSFYFALQQRFVILLNTIGSISNILRCFGVMLQ